MLGFEVTIPYRKDPRDYSALDELFDIRTQLTEEALHNLVNPNRLTVVAKDFVDQELFARANSLLPESQRVNFIVLGSRDTYDYVKDAQGKWFIELKTGQIDDGSALREYQFPKTIHADLLCTSCSDLVRLCPDQSLLSPFNTRATRIGNNKILANEIYKKLKLATPITCRVSRNFSKKTIAKSLKESFGTDFSLMEVVLNDFVNRINAHEFFGAGTENVISKLPKKAGLVFKPHDDCQGSGVNFVDFVMFNDLASQVKRYFKKHPEQKWILIQERIESLPLTDEKNQKLDWNFRVLASKHGIMGIEARVDKFGGPVNKSLGAEIWSPEKLYYHLRQAGNDLSKSKWNKILNNLYQECILIAKELDTEFLGADCMIDQKFQKFQVQHIEINVGYVGGISSLHEIGETLADKYFAPKKFLSYLNANRSKRAFLKQENIQVIHNPPDFYKLLLTLAQGLDYDIFSLAPDCAERAHRINNAFMPFLTEGTNAFIAARTIADAIEKSLGASSTKVEASKATYSDYYHEKMASLYYLIADNFNYSKAYNLTLQHVNLIKSELKPKTLSISAVAAGKEGLWTSSADYLNQLLDLGNLQKYKLYYRTIRELFYDNDKPDNFLYSLCTILVINELSSRGGEYYLKERLSSLNSLIQLQKTDQVADQIFLLDPAYLYLFRAEVLYRLGAGPSGDLEKFIKTRPYIASNALRKFKALLSDRLINFLEERIKD